MNTSSPWLFLFALLLAPLAAEEGEADPPAVENPSDKEEIPEDIEAWKVVRKAELAELGFTERDLGIILEEEVNILKETLLFPKEKRPAERERLTRGRVKKFISASMKFSAYPQKYIDKLVDSWPEWFTNSKEKRFALLQESLDAMEAEELSAREAKGRSLLTEVLRKIELHYKDVGLQPGTKARGQFEASWERLIKTTQRLSKDVLIAEKTNIKRSGYDPVALKIISEAIDSLFNP